MPLPFDSASGGKTIGVAGAKITTDVSSFSQARAIVVKESRVMAQAPKEIGKSVQDTEKQVNTALGKINNLFAESRKHMQQFANTGLGQLQQNLQVIQQKFNLISAAAAGFVGLGTRSAQQFKRIELGLTAMAGSQKRANDIMAEMRDMSEEFRQPYDQLLEGALSFIPIANQTGASMRELLLLSQKLQLTNPMKTSGAIAFSIKEALSGDFVSLKDVADLAKSQRTELKKFIDKGDVQGFLDALNEILEKRGITTEALREMGESGITAFSRASGAVNEAMATAFTPFLEKIVLPLANKFADFVTQLNQTNPELLQFAGGVAVAVATVAPLLLAVNQLIAAYGTLKGLGTIALPAIKGAAVTGAAIAGGVALGEQVVKGLANAGVQGGDFDRIRQGADPVENALKRLGQLVVIFADEVLKIGKHAAIGAVALKNGFSRIGDVLELAKYKLVSAFASVVESIYSAVSSLPDWLIGGNVKQGSQALVTLAGSARENADAEIAKLEEALKGGILTISEADLQAIDATYNDLRESIVGGIGRFVGVIPPEAEKLVLPHFM